MKVPNGSGVYCLKAHTKRLLYIGSTNNLSKRQAIHLYQIRQRDYNKGCKAMIDAFIEGDYITFEVIELCENYLDREQHWLNIYKLDNSFKLVNQFDAIRLASKSTEEFREKMSNIRRKKWKDPIYRANMLEKLKKTQLSATRLNKTVYVFSVNGNYICKYNSATEAANTNSLNKSSLTAAARGEYMSKFLYKDKIWIYEGVLLKLDELLEAHQELRVISSEAWKSWKKKYHERSTTN